jgi:hypothetical protein
MPRGDKSSYTSKQKRQAADIERGYKQRGVSTGEAERRAWATVNKETGGGKKKGAAKKKRRTSSSTSRTTSSRGKKGTSRRKRTTSSRKK